LYHGKETAEETEAEFNKIFSKGLIPDEIPEFEIREKIKIIDILTQSSICKSGGEAKRLIKQNAISIDGSKVTDMFAEIDKECIIKVGKRRFLKVVKK